jgi:hypothetical protein
MLFSALPSVGRCAAGSEPRSVSCLHLISLPSSHPNPIPSTSEITNRHVPNRTVQPPPFPLHPQSEDLDPLNQDPPTERARRLAASRPRHPIPEFQIALIQVRTVLFQSAREKGVRCVVSQSQNPSRGRPSNSALRHRHLRPPCPGRRRLGAEFQPGETLVACCLLHPQRLIPANEQRTYVPLYCRK